MSLSRVRFLLFTGCMAVGAGCAGGGSATRARDGGVAGLAGGAGSSQVSSGGAAGRSLASAAGTGSSAPGVGAVVPSAQGSAGSGAQPNTGQSGSAQGGAGGTGGFRDAATAACGSGSPCGGTGGIAAPHDAGIVPDAGEPSDSGTLSGDAPDAAACVDAVCFDIFDCAIFHLDALDCGFTRCEDFICKP